MYCFIKDLFVKNWLRKCIAIILALIIWILVHDSIIITKEFVDVPIKITNKMDSMVYGIKDEDGSYIKKVALLIKGRKNLIDRLNSNDMHVLIDGNWKTEEWVANIGHENIKFKYFNFDKFENLDVLNKNLIVKVRKLITEEIEVFLTTTGSPPAGFQFMDIFPNKSHVVVYGSKSHVENLKKDGLKITVDLRDISKDQLYSLSPIEHHHNTNVVRLFIKSYLEKSIISNFCNEYVKIKDGNFEYSHIDFLCSDFIKIDRDIPISIYHKSDDFFYKTTSTLKIGPNKITKNINGIEFLPAPIYVTGISPLFVNLVKDMLEIVIIVDEFDDKKLTWTYQFINKNALEEGYVNLFLSDFFKDGLSKVKLSIRELILRDKFRNYANKLRFYTNTREKLKIYLSRKENIIYINEKF